MKKQFTLSKHERLKSRKLIEQLFKEAPSFMLSPYKVFYLFTDKSGDVLQAGFGASSRTFKKATDRNRIKRVTKEAYRTNKVLLSEKLNASGFQMAIFLVYTGRALPEYDQVIRKIELILQRLINLVHERTALPS